MTCCTAVAAVLCDPSTLVGLTVEAVGTADVMGSLLIRFIDGAATDGVKDLLNDQMRLSYIEPGMSLNV